MLLPVVAFPDLRDDKWVALARSSTPGDRLRVVASSEALSLRPLDLGGKVGEHGAVVADVLACGRGEKTSLGGDHDWRWPATFCRQASELPERHRMEGSGRRRISETEARQAAPELRGGLTSEGESEHVRCRGSAFVDPPGDATREHPCLAGAGSGQHTQRPCLSRDRFALLGVASGQETPGQVARPRHARLHEQTVAVGCLNVQGHAGQSCTGVKCVGARTR